ncbi:hypothetical protein E2K98_17970 [Bacillus salipaludis]|uniref:Uncharacterized protein n=1 Tax=Bacillus salipaludis TaxID=2547811 RepID=A0A4R5VNF6_9BACI|nr:hypothetical protein [Bacillus salipaludis]MDQ6595857.1 hypothetical protein [Bacillus salipaludis]TDK59811.1 hypothetical protein E2K98_17970 [Bacillus salipaludis]
MNSLTRNLDLHAQGNWLPIVLSLLLFLYALFMPKKEIGWREFYVTFGLIGYIAWISDSVLGKMFDLVDFGNPKVTGIGEFLSYSLIPSSLSVIYLNYLKKTNRWMLAIIFILISTLIEWGMRKVGYMKTNGWSFIISVPLYFVVFSFLLPLHKKLIRCKS